MFTSSLDIQAIVTEPDIWATTAPLAWDGKPPKGYRSVGPTTVPRGFTTDLASIPQALRSVLDRNGVSRRPAVLHDWLYALQPCRRSLADATLRAALIADGETPFRAWVYWAGVRAGGWRPWAAHKAAGFGAKNFLTVGLYRAWLSAA